MGGQLSEQAHVMRGWSFFYSHSLSLFYVPLCLACLEFFSQSVLEFACFLGLSMLPSYCGRVLIALRAYAECKYFVPSTRKSWACWQLHCHSVLDFVCFFGLSDALLIL